MPSIGTPSAGLPDLGYESATVDAALQFADNNTQVNVRFAIREGPQIFVDHVLIVGNVRTSTNTIERELQVKPGAPFSLAAINESQRRLTTLGCSAARGSASFDMATRTAAICWSIEEAPAGPPSATAAASRGSCWS